MALTLITQGESRTPDKDGRYYGAELFQDMAEGYWSARFHCRTYDGMRVASSWTTEQIRLDADSTEQARAEVRRLFREFVDVYRAGDTLG